MTQKIPLRDQNQSRSQEEESKRRRKEIEQALGISLENIGKHTLDLENVHGKNCENVIGAAQLPMGVAGPLNIQEVGQELAEDIYLPLATTEGTLVASVNRGCRATQENGITTAIERVGTTRAPVFEVRDLQEGQVFMKWIKEHEEDIRVHMKKCEPFIELRSFQAWQVGKNVFVRFACDCSEAMGMNMITVAIRSAIDVLIEPKTGVRCVSVSGNMCTDKKPSATSYVLGRGRTVHAETTISQKIVQEVLKTTPEAIVETWTRKTMVGSVRAGTVGANAHAANIVAALYLATGQDPAHVVEASSAIVTTECVQDDLYMSVTIPSILVGVVGGGTALPTQREALQLLGVQEPSTGEVSDRLARIVGGAVLVGELSLHAAQAAAHLATSHAEHGRGTKRTIKEAT